VLDATTAILDEATEYVAERRRTMIFAVRDRLRAEQRHLASTRGDCWCTADTSSRRAPSAGESPIANSSAPTTRRRRLAQGWSIVTTRDGAVVTVARRRRARRPRVESG
jgi:hypothetical protein